jgi:hypothetical protein
MRFINYITIISFSFFVTSAFAQQIETSVKNSAASIKEQSKEQSRLKNNKSPAILAKKQQLTKQASTKKSSIKSRAVFIESQVKGSQEQPNVIYVMPWRGIEHPVEINANQQHIVLPKFSPINPKVFRKQVKIYYQQQSLNNSDSKE